MSSNTPKTPARGNTRAGRGGRGRGNPMRKPQATAKPVSTKFKGNCEKLHGAIFDCSDYKQADNFVSSLKRISEYVGSEYKHGGDIRSSIINQARFVVVIPTRPTIVDEAAPTAVGRSNSLSSKARSPRTLNATSYSWITSKKHTPSCWDNALTCFKAK